MYIIQEDAAGLAQWMCCSAVRSVTERSHRPCRPMALVPVGSYSVVYVHSAATSDNLPSVDWLRSVRPHWSTTSAALHPSATSGAAHAVPHPSGPLARSLTHTRARSCTRSCCTQAPSTHAHAHVHAVAAHVAAVRKHVRRGQPGGRFDRSCTAANQRGQPHRRA